MNLQTVYLSNPINEVRKVDGTFFMRATQQQILTMLSYGVLVPNMTEAGKLQHWKLKKGTSINRLRSTLKSGSGHVSAEDSKTCVRDGRGYRHHPQRCAAYAYA